MSTEKCGECGAHFVWDPDIGSGVCLDCGTLQDPTQCVLSTHIEPADKGQGDLRHWAPQATLKSFRTTNGWNLSGQGKEVTFDRNKNAMHQYVSTVATRLGHPGLAPRAQVLFDQAMIHGSFRWGRKARLVAGACLAIALREAHKGATMQDIAFLLSETPVSVARAFTIVLNLLGIQLMVGDPSWHLPVLQTWLKEILAQQPCPLPSKLVKIIKSLHIPTVLRMASSLSDLTLRVGLLTHLPSPPTSCAIFILALEGESLSSLPNCGELAKALGKRFGASKDVVMRRYKIIYDQVDQWLSDVPWLDDRESSAKRKGTQVAKRVIVARGLKDVVQFKDNVWKAKFEASGRPEAQTEVDDEDGHVSATESTTSTELKLKRKQDLVSVVPSETRKKRRTRQGKQLDVVSRFLLSPLGTSGEHRSKRAALPSLDVASHLLTAETLSLDHAPTRLQILANARSEADIADEELFEEGELQGFICSAEETAALAQICDWAHDGDKSDEGHTVHAQKRDRGRGGTTRVNMEALNRLLADTETDGEDKDDDEWATVLAGDLQVFEDQDAYPTIDDGKTQDLKNLLYMSYTDTAGREEVEPWRPLSPSAYPSWNSDDFDFEG